MTAMQLSAELFRELSIIAEDETMMQKAVKALKRITAKKEDPTRMSKEEFFAKVSNAEKQYRQGKCHAMLPGESFMDFRKRIGR